MYLEGASTGIGTIESFPAVAPTLPEVTCEAISPQRAEVHATWQHWEASRISHHGESCCEVAREWLTATDHTHLGSGSPFTGPRWLRQRFRWGASRFPIHWCEAVRKKTLDCGAHASLAYEVFRFRGVPVLRVQMVQQFSEIAAFQWTNNWNPDNADELPWIDRDLIYHEGCAILTGSDRIKVWDSSAGWWLDPRPSEGYGAMRAIRLSDASIDHGEASLKWGTNTLPISQWSLL